MSTRRDRPNSLVHRNYFRGVVLLAGIALCVGCGGRDDVLEEFHLRDGWTLKVIGWASFDSMNVSIDAIAKKRGGPAIDARGLIVVDSEEFKRTYLSKRVIFSLYQDWDCTAVAVYEARHPKKVLAVFDLQNAVAWPRGAYKMPVGWRRATQYTRSAISRIGQVNGEGALSFEALSWGLSPAKSESAGSERVDGDRGDGSAGGS